MQKKGETETGTVQNVDLFYLRGLQLQVEVEETKGGQIYGEVSFKSMYVHSVMRLGGRLWTSIWTWLQGQVSLQSLPGPFLLVSVEN